MNWRGVSVNSWDIFQNTLVEQDFANMKSLGYNTVKTIVNVGSLIDENDPSWPWRVSWDSNEPVIDTWTRYVNWASNHGLNVIVDLSLYGPGFGGTVNEDTFWINKDVNYPLFVELWRRLVTRFDSNPHVVAYHILHNPGHAGSGVGYEDSYMNELTPNTIEAIRSLSGKTISWMPFSDGGLAYVNGQLCQTGWYATAQPLPYNNIIYGFNFYVDKISNSGGPDGLAAVTHYGASYLYDTEALQWHLQPAINFKNQHNVPMGCYEWGIRIEFDDGRGWSDIDPTRLDWVRDVASMFQTYGFDWDYWLLSNVATGYGGTTWSIINPDQTVRTALVNQMTPYIPVLPTSSVVPALVGASVVAGVLLYVGTKKL